MHHDSGRAGSSAAHTPAGEGVGEGAPLVVGSLGITTVGELAAVPLTHLQVRGRGGCPPGGGQPGHHDSGRAGSSAAHTPTGEGEGRVPPWWWALRLAAVPLTHLLWVNGRVGD